jgi:diadenosine tetraphosphatase ApaH/serine/threonine PP2A family protein phosphatase
VRVALLSDVHANLPALRAVLDALDPLQPEALWVTGDTVGYGGEPSEVLGLLREHKALLLQGNHDRAVATGDGLDWFNPPAAEAAAMHSSWLSADERAFLGALPAISEVDRFTLCHGSLRDPMWEYVISAPVAAASLERAKTPFACHGHTHVPALYVDDQATLTGLRSVRPTPGRAYELGPRSLMNPGSVGQPRDGDARAAFAMLDTDTAKVTFHRVAYPIEEAQRRIRARGLPDIFAERLAVGV